MRVAGRFLKGHPGLAINDYIELVEQAAIDFAMPEEPDTDVRAVLGLSAKALARENRTLAERWQMLAVFPDEFDRDAAAAVWQVKPATASLQLSNFADRSMIMHDDASRRWRLHDLMRDVAHLTLEGGSAEHLLARLEAARFQHARYYSKLLANAGKLFLGESQRKDCRIVNLRSRREEYPRRMRLVSSKDKAKLEE